MIFFKYKVLKNSVLYCPLLRGVQTLATLSKCCQQHLWHDRLQTIVLQGKIRCLDCFIYVHVILLFRISDRNRWLSFSLFIYKHWIDEFFLIYCVWTVSVQIEMLPVAYLFMMNKKELKLKKKEKRNYIKNCEKKKIKKFINLNCFLCHFVVDF